MKLVVFGLTISSSWGNGHATLWRGLCRGLAGQGHDVVFFERDVPYYAQHRDLWELPQGKLVLYRDWDTVRPAARHHLAEADAALVTSYCPDGVQASELVLSSPAKARAFYDLDTPVTLSQLRAGHPIPYLPPWGLGDFDLVLSYTGGKALEALQRELQARNVAPLYGSVDPQVHHPVPPIDSYRADLSYLGTYAEDRQRSLDELFLQPARARPGLRFVIGGAQYPENFPWTPNLHFVRHLPPPEHAAFFCSARLTLNVTRAAMARMGYCPSGRLFEAAACGVPILSDGWEGLDDFFRPGKEILVARNTAEAIQALETQDDVLSGIARAARDRVLAEHTAEIRARELVELLQGAPHRETADVAQPAGT